MSTKTTSRSLTSVNRLILMLFLVIGFSSSTLGQTPTNMLNPPDSMCGIPYPITPSFAYNETRFLGVGLTTTFTYQILSPVAGPTVSENVGVGALSSGATSYTFATPITSGLTMNALNTIRFCVAGNCADYTCFINPITVGGNLTGTKSSMCVGDDGGTLTLSGNVGTIYDWEKSTDNGATWTPVDGVGTRHITSTFSPGVLTTTTYYRAISRSGYLNTPMPNGRATVGTCDPEYSTTFILTVYPFPAAPLINSNTPICSGNTINLTAASPASGATYAWTTTAVTPIPPGVQNLQNPSINSSTTSMTGNYSCTVTANGCTSTAATIAVTVNQTPAAPTLGSNTPVCTGNNVNLTANSVMGGTFTWAGPDSFNSSQQNPSIIAATIAASGTYSATNTVSGCTGPAGTTSVVMNPTPSAPIAATNAPVCSGTTLTVSSSTIPGATYTWSGPAGAGVLPATQNLSFPSATTAYSGTYTVFATVSGCPSLSTSVDVVVNPLPAAPTISSNTPVCTGGTLILTSNTFASSTYNWSGPGFTSSIQNPTRSNVTAAMAGSYTLSITTSTTGCTGPTSSTNVVVNTTPAAPSAANNGPICEGTTLTLTGGSVAGATYAWTGPGGFTSTAQSPTVTTSATATNDGTYSITATVSGCTSAPGTTVAIVNDQPDAPVLSSNSAICVGSNLNLFCQTVSGATYSWNGPGFTSSTQNPVRTSATAAMSGTYTCTVTVNGCTSVAASVDVVVSPIPSTPTVTSNTPVCSGGVLNLTTPAVTGATYSWTGPNLFASSSQNPSIANVTTAGSGTYSVTVTVAGCSSSAGTGAVVINPTPATPTPSSNSPVCSGSTINLSTSPVAGATYSWTGPSGFTPSSLQNPTIANANSTHSGMYYVTVTVSGCTSATGSTSVTVNPTPAAPTLGSNSPVCAGSTLQLTSNVIAGATYNWSGPGFTSTFQNPSISNVTAANAGTYSLVTSVGSCSSTSSISVTINPRPAQPTAGSNAPLCEGSTLNLTCTPLAGATYSWTTTSSTGFTSAVQNPTIPSATTSHTGVYSVTTTLAGCTSLPGTVNVAVNAIPNAPVVSSNSPVCVGGTINLNANTVTGATYGWTGPAASMPSSSQNPTVAGATAANAGTYSCTITMNGCTSSASTASVSVIATPATPTVTTNSPICEGTTIALSTPNVVGASYAWTGPNGFTANTRNPNIPLATTSEAGTYSVIATIGSCSSAAGTANVVVNPTPASPAVSSNTPVCVGGTINLTATTVAGATYSWSGPGSPAYSSTLQNPTIASATQAMSGIYTVVATISGCNSGPASTAVTVNPIPAAPTATSTSPACTGGSVNLSASTITGATYNWTGPGSFASSLQNPTVSNVTAGSAGTYSVVATIGGCTGPAGTTNVVINTSPAAPTAGSNGPLCVGATLNLTATTVAGATYQWTGPGSPAFSSTAQNPSFPTTSTNQSGVYSVVAIAGGCSSTPGTVNVNVYAIPAAPVVSSNSPVCEGAALNLYAEQISGASYAWSASTGFSSTVQNPTINSVQLTDAVPYNVTVTVNGCVSPAASTSVTVNDTPNAPTAGSNSPLCAGDDLNLTASSTTPGVSYHWDGPGSPAFSSNSQNPTITNVSSANAGSYFVTATLGSCTSPSGIAPVTISTAPTTLTASHATTGGIVCEGTDLQLFANPNVVGAVYNWSGPGGFASTDKDPVIPNVQLSQGGVYSVVATVGGGCSGAPATTNVTLTPAPAVPTTVASNSPVCSQTPLNFTASSVAGATYDWTGPNGFASTLQNPTIPSASLAASGTYTMRTFDGTCYSAPTDLSVVVNVTPNAPVATNNGPICQGSTLNLMASSIAGATYQWSGPSGYSSSVQNPTIPGATPANNGSYCVIATVGSCSSPSGCTTVNVVTPSAPATISSNGPLCEGTTLQLTASTVTGAVYNWSGPNGFASISQNPTISAITLAGEGTYTLTTSAAGVCPGSSTTLFVDVIPAPTAPVSATSNSPICTASPINLTSSTVASMGYSWTGPNGFTSTMQNPTIASATINHSGTYSVKSNDGTCLSAQSASVVVLVNPTPDAPTATNDGPACAGSNVQLSASSIAGATYTWSGPGTYSASVQNPVLTGVTTAQSGMYSVVATVAGCPGPAGTTNVVVSAATAAGTVGTSATVCSGSNGGTLTLTGYAGTILYWVASTDGGSTWVNVVNTSATLNYSNLTQTTMYAAVVQQGSCPETRSAAATITVIPEAIGGVVSNDYPNPELCAGNNSGVLTLTGYAGNIVQWEVTTDGGLTWDTIANTTDTLSYLNLIKNTTYRVLLQGCTSYDYSEAKILVVTFDACNDDIVIATMVTPNGDQHNDTWLIEDLASYPPMDVTIMNRYGTQIFHVEHYMNEWDATYNGDLLPDGTYYYVIKMEGSDKIYKGHINVLK